MSTDAALDTWIDRYLKAWNSNDPADIGALFSDDARYRTDPWATPWTGRQGIVDGWLARADDPGDTAFEWHRVAQDGDLRVLEGTTKYRTEGITFSNLWLVRLDADGRCSDFTEYWMEHPRS